MPPEALEALDFYLAGSGVQSLLSDDDDDDDDDDDVFENGTDGDVNTQANGVVLELVLLLLKMMTVMKKKTKEMTWWGADGLM